jgi:hypothetical protein
MAEEPTRGTLTLICSATLGEISTGAVYSQEDWARARRAKLLVHCPFCGKEHLFNFSDAVLRPIA